MFVCNGRIPLCAFERVSVGKKRTWRQERRGLRLSRKVQNLEFSLQRKQNCAPCPSLQLVRLHLTGVLASAAYRVRRNIDLDPEPTTG